MTKSASVYVSSIKSALIIIPYFIVPFRYPESCIFGNLARSLEGLIENLVTRTLNASLPKRVEALRNGNIVQVSAGDSHSLAHSGSGWVFSWDVGSSGQLGHGSSTHLLSPRLIADLEFGNQEGTSTGKDDTS